MRHLTALPSTRKHLPPVVQPLHGAYDAARTAWNLHADLRPAGVTVAATVDQVRDAVLFARDHGLRIVPQTTGHLAPALPPVDDALLLKTALHAGIDVDAVARTAWVPAGAEWQHVVEAVAPYGLTALHGSSPDVGVVGYLVGGGLSFYGRRYGLAANHVRSIELVTAEGEVVRCDPDRHPDLFWALRGGGGNFGVVTGVEIDLLAIPEAYYGAIFWAGRHAHAVLDAWREWCADAPDSVTTSIRLMRLPDLPDVPEPLRDVPLVAFDGVLLGTRAEGEALLAPLRAAAPAMMDTFAYGPTAGVMRMHGDPEQPVPGLGDGLLLDGMNAAMIDTLIGLAGEESGSPLLFAELRQLGGALAQAPATSGARGSLEGEVAFFGVGLPTVPALARAIRDRLDALKSALAPWDTGRVYLNFAENPATPAAAAFDDAAYARLREVRAVYDPGEVFVASHAIPVAD